MSNKEDIKFLDDNEIELVINSKFYKLMSLIKMGAVVAAKKEDINNSDQDWNDVRFAQMYQQGFKDGLQHATELRRKYYRRLITDWVTTTEGSQGSQGDSF